MQRYAAARRLFNLQCDQHKNAVKAYCQNARKTKWPPTQQTARTSCGTGSGGVAPVHVAASLQ